MFKTKVALAAVLASTAIAVHAELPNNPESGPQPAPYGISDPAPTPAGFNQAVFPQNPESGPQPAPYGVTDRAPTPAGSKQAVFPDNSESGPAELPNVRGRQAAASQTGMSPEMPVN